MLPRNTCATPFRSIRPSSRPFEILVTPAFKITYIIQCNNDIHINVGRVYRLLKVLQLPQISTKNRTITMNINTSAIVPIIFTRNLQIWFEAAILHISSQLCISISNSTSYILRCIEQCRFILSL